MSRHCPILRALAALLVLLVLSQLYILKPTRNHEARLAHNSDLSLRHGDLGPHPLDLAAGFDPVDPAFPAPALTLIALWYPSASPDTRTGLLPNFIASAAANPCVDVLVLKFDKDNVGGACEPLASAVYAPNVREVCLATDEYHDLHVEFLCRQWQCNSAQRRRTRELVEVRFRTDRVRSRLISPLVAATN